MKTMKKLQFVATLALAFAALTATAAKPVVKVTESYGDGIHYYVKYTINGIEYRSDMAPYRVNQIAWEYMSDDDKMKTVNTVTYVWDARQEQFGTLFAAEMGKWYDTKMGYVEAAKIKQDELVKKYHSDLWNRFSSGKVDEYYHNYVELSGIAHEDTHLDNYPDLYVKKASIGLLFKWAQEAYSRLGPGEWRRTEAAMKSISGDLIQLICDRVLVPNITPAGMLSGVESMGSKILGAVLDMANTLSGAQDKLVTDVIGERTTAAIARKVIDNANEAIAINRNIVITCMTELQKLRGEIMNEYPALKAAYDKRYDEVWSAYNAKLKAARDALDASPMSDTGLAQAKRAGELKDAADSARRRHEEVKAEFDAKGGYLGKDEELIEKYSAAKAAAERASENYDKYAKTVFDSLVARCNAWQNKYFGTITIESADDVQGPIGALVAKYDAIVSTTPAISNELAQTIVYSDSAVPTTNIAAQAVFMAEAELTKFFKDSNEMRTKLQALYAETFSVLSEACQELGTLLSDEAGMPCQTPWHSSGSGNTDLTRFRTVLDALLFPQVPEYGDSDGSPWSELLHKLRRCKYVEDMFSVDDEPRYRLMRMRMDQYKQQYENLVDEVAAARVEYDRWQSVLDQVDKDYDEAQKNLQTFGNTLPVFVTDQSIMPDGLLILDDNTALGKEFLPPNGTADAAKANAYRQQLDTIVDKYAELRSGSIHANRNVDIAKRIKERLEAAGFSKEGNSSKKSKKVRMSANEGMSDSNGNENIRKLLALWKDFSNRGVSHANEMTYFADLLDNEEEYKTNIRGHRMNPMDGTDYIVQNELSDPFYCVARRALCYASETTTWDNPMGLYMPGWLTGYGYSGGYLVLKESGYYNRGVSSYAYYAKGYYKTYFGNEPDPYNDIVKPFIDEIEGARAAAMAKIYCTITFDPNGGEIAEWVTNTICRIGGTIDTFRAAKRSGDYLVGWFTERVGGTEVTRDTIVTKDMTLYAHWESGATGIGGSGGGSATPGYDAIDEKDIVAPYDVPKAVTLAGAAYDGNDLVGLVELKLGKVNAKKGTGKVSGNVTTLDGKKHAIKSFTVSGLDGTAPVAVSLNVKDLGTMDVTIGGALFAGSLGGWHVQTEAMGGDWSKGTACVTVRMGDLSVFPGSVIQGLLPDEETATVKKGKWTFEKAASVKWAKPKKGAAQPEIYDEASGKGLIIDDAKGKTNYPGLKLSYTPKNGTFKGSFKVYALEGSGKSTKLKTYTVNVNGFVVGGVGYGTATCKKPAVTWPVTVR